MKKHLKKLRPLLLLTALFLLTNCQEEFEENKPVEQQKNGSKYTILTGETARAKKAELLIELDKDGGKGISNLQQVLKGGTTDPAFRDMMDIKEYIDDREVFKVEQANGNINYTYRVNMPDATDDKFYNLVVKISANGSKTTLYTYTLDKMFTENYQIDGDFSKFTGEIKVDVVAMDGDVPCEEEPHKPVPVSGGIGVGAGGVTGGGSGGGNGGGGGIGGPINPGNPGVPYNQLLVDIKINALKIVKAKSYSIEVGPIEGGIDGGGTIPGTLPGMFDRYIIQTPSVDGETDPCGDGEDIGVFDPQEKHKSDCDKLKKLLANATIKNSLNSLKGNLEGFKERLFTFSMNGRGETNAKAETNNSGNTASMSVNNGTYGVAHTHPSGTPSAPSGIYKMFSIADLKSVYIFTKNYAGTGPTAAPLFFNMMVIDEYTYIVFPNNVYTFSNLNTIFEDKDKLEKLDQKLNSKYNDVGSPDANNHNGLAEVFFAVH